MKSRFGFIVLLAALAGCGREQKPDHAPMPGMEGDSGVSIRSRIAPASRALAVVKLPADSPQLSRLKIARVVTAAVPIDELIAPGKIEMNPNRVSKIALPVAGRVTQVLVGLGDFVQKGQPLLRLDSPDAGAAQSAYRQAQAGIAQSKAMLAKAEADLARANDLFANRAIAGKEVIASQTVVTQSHAQLDQAVAALEDARQRLEVLGLRPGSFQQPIVVPATVSGKVIEIAVVPGEYRTDTSAAVMTIADLSTVWAAADVPEADIRYVSAGDQVAIHFGAYPNETFRARVMKVADLLDPQTRTIKVLAELPNPHGRFHPDMFVQMRQSRGSESLPVVPRGAVLETQGKTTVYVERARGEFYEVPVTIAREEGDRIALRSGVKAGDQVVVQGTVLLKGY